MKLSSIKIVSIIGLMILVLVLAIFLNEALRVNLDARIVREKQVCFDARKAPRIVAPFAHYLRGGTGPRIICE